MKKINLGILGPKGRMGQSIIKESEGFPEIKLSALCEKPDHEDVGKIYHGLKIIDDIEELVIKSEVIIDFTSPLSTLNLIDCLRKKKDTALIEEKPISPLALSLSKFIPLYTNLPVDDLFLPLLTCSPKVSAVPDGASFLYLWCDSTISTSTFSPSFPEIISVK